MRVKIEFRGGPHDGETLTIANRPPPVLRMVHSGGQPLAFGPGREETEPIAGIDAEVSCYHLERRVPLLGRWRYRYHGPA